VRTTYVLINGELVEKRYAPKPKTAYVIPDLPDYQSPVDDRIVHGRSGRREDLKRTQSRPWEGREQEEKEASRARQYDEQKLDRRIDESAQHAYAQLHPDKRRLLRG
jgi:hypothetical protein